MTQTSEPHQFDSRARGGSWGSATKRLIGSNLTQLRLVGLSALLLGSSLLGPPRAGALDDPSGEAIDYATYFGIDLTTAELEVSIIDAAAGLQIDLAAQLPDEFAGLWVEHQPKFAVVVALTTNREEQVRGLAGGLIGPHLRMTRHEFSLRALEKAADALPPLEIPHSLEVDVLRNRVVVGVVAASKADAEAAARLGELQVPPWIRPMLEAKPVLGLPRAIADIYGGLTVDPWTTGLGGTTGFSIRHNPTGTTGILTAGHLANNLKYLGLQLPYYGGSLTTTADAQWNETPGFVDQPWIRSSDAGGHTTITSIRSYNNIVIGSVLCKYGRTTGYGCGVVESKTVDPDGIFGPYTAVFVRLADCDGSDAPLGKPGDSGGPVFSNLGQTATAIMTHEDPGDIFCSGKVIVNSISHSTAKLNLTILVGP